MVSGEASVLLDGSLGKGDRVERNFSLHPIFSFHPAKRIRDNVFDLLT
jgi:hypothetical protein